MSLDDHDDKIANEFFSRPVEEQKKLLSDTLRKIEFKAYIAGAKSFTDILIFSAQMKNEESISLSTVKFFNTMFSSKEMTDMMFDTVLAPDNTLREAFAKWRSEMNKNEP